MISNALKEHIWQGFFSDKNVRFPDKPRLIKEISIYDAPYGLGVQFRGGPKKLVIRGKGAGKLFQALAEVMNGNNSLEDIFDLLDSEYDINDISSMLKILHAHNLLIDADTSDVYQTTVNNVQLNYYNRIKGSTGFHPTGHDIHEAIHDCKILLIGSENLIPAILTNLELIGFKNVGLCYQKGEAYLKYNHYFSQEFLSEMDMTGHDENSIINQINLKIDDYQYVIIAFENPNRHFLTALNDFCIAKDKPSVFFSLIENNFEIGPFVLPRGSACFTCSVLRKNSYNEDALFENIYQDGLSSNNTLNDSQIKGVDLLATNIAAGVLVSEFSKIIASYSSPQLLNTIIEYDGLNGQFNTVEIIRVPGCQSCSN